MHQLRQDAGKSAPCSGQPQSAPPGGVASLAPSEAVQAVLEALTRLGDEARAWELAEYIRVRLGIRMRAGQVAIIRSELRQQGPPAALAWPGIRPGAADPT